MKTLQSSFTTPDQSRRMLGLGVPADSADCFYRDWDCLLEHPGTDTSNYVHVRKTRIEQEACYMHFAGNLPCWSVGRLIKMLKICITDKNELREIFDELEMCADETAVLVQTFKEFSDVIDFSKLKEE